MEGTIDFDQLCLFPTNHREELVALMELPNIPRATVNVLDPNNHPLITGAIFHSFGGSFAYRVVGPICRLYDREQLPWPCCRLSWRGKEPSWRRIGSRYVSDIATKGYPSYSVELWDQLNECWYGQSIFTFYLLRPAFKSNQWWYQKYKPSHGY